MRNNREREANLEAFKKGECRFLICTDVAARGIDVKQLPYVINVTLPDKPENYVHRIGTLYCGSYNVVVIRELAHVADDTCVFTGRVGRAEHIGLAISLVSSVKEKVWYYDKRKWNGKRLSTQLAQIDRNGTPVGGGCCTWYDEPELFKKVEGLVGQKIPSLVTGSKGELQLPPDVAAKVAAGASFGEQVGGDGFAEVCAVVINLCFEVYPCAGHLMLLCPAVLRCCVFCRP